MKKIINAILCIFLSLCLVSCKSTSIYEKIANEVIDAYEESNENVEYEVIETKDFDSFYDENDYKTMDIANSIYCEFALKLLKNSINKNDNEIISPLSVYYAIGMLTNAASGDSQKELETLLGMNVDDINKYIKDINNSYVNGCETYYIPANSIWFNNNLGINLKKEYIDTINEYYGPCVFEDNFKDAKKVSDSINSWTDNHTNGGINDIIGEQDIKEDTPLLLLNALMCGDEWSYKFNSNDTYKQTFYKYDDTLGAVDMMHQTIDGYWHLDNCDGFAKKLDNQVNVVAILPNKGIDIYDFINNMSPSIFSDITHNVIYEENYKETSDGWCSVDVHLSNISFPKFTYDKEYDLNESFKKLGLKNIFDYNTSDFSNLAEGDQSIVDKIFVEKIKQKDTIEVNEDRVVAAAVTLVELGLGGAGCDVDNYIYHDVVFDRPFIYALMCGNIPIFIGVVTNLGDAIDSPIDNKPTGVKFKLTNNSGLINIRNNPSTSAKVVGGFEKGQTAYAYESKQSDGYTWYRIGDDMWVANNGEWIKTETIE